MKTAATTKMNWLESIRRNSGWILAVYLFGGYLILSCIFAVIYNEFVPLIDPPTIATEEQSDSAQKKTDDKSREPFSKIQDFTNSLYFSVVTGTTLGYGDFSPKNIPGKIIVIIHVLFSTVFFAIAVSVVFLKLVYPKDTVILSKKIMYLQKENKLIFRIININRSKLINPEIRIVLAMHTQRGGTSHHIGLMKIDDLPVIGNHDLLISIHDKTKAIFEQIDIAKAYNKKAKTEDEKSRFSIKISITGSYGFTSYSHYHKYKVTNIIEGNRFAPIEYPENFHKKIRKYNIIPLFWEKFHGIE